MTRDLVNLAKTLGPGRVAEIIEALVDMVNVECSVNGELYARHSATNEQAIRVLVDIGLAEWIQKNRGLARWKP